jgi:hypothetical protein
MRCGLPAFAMLALLGLLCCSPAPEPEPEKPAAPTAESDPGVTLSLSVGLINNRLLFSNSSATLLQRILVVINEGSGETEFRHTISLVQPNATIHYSPGVCAAKDGSRWDPAQNEAKTITVYADTGAGRGRWYGSY